MTATPKQEAPLAPSPGPGSLSRRTVMQGMSVAGLGMALGSGVTFSGRSWAASRPPNVIYISIDDLAWKELGCYGNTFNETPNIDRLASQGLRFTDAYSAASICSPTRASLMTGRYPANVGITDYLREMPAPSENFLSPDVTTIPDAVGGAGYGSGLVGKWHLTEDYSADYRNKLGNPYAHGFDDVRASETRYIGGGDYFHPYFFMPELGGTDGEYLTDRLTAEAVDFIDAHQDRPFFMHLSNYAVHTALSAKPELVAKYRDKPGAGQNGNNAVLAAMLQSIDEQVGAVVAKLEDLGIADNTLVMVMSDNGGDPAVTSNAPLRGHKSHLYEGGIRVAMVASWPALIAPGRVSSVPVSTVDVFPTVLDIAGIRAEQAPALDGETLGPIFRDPEHDLERDLYWVYPHFHFLGAVPQAAVRSGRYKLIQYLKDRRVELYDLEQDIGETNDLAEQMPATATELRRKLEAHVEQTGILALPPTAEDYAEVELAEDFEADGGTHTVLTRPASGQEADAHYEDGALHLTGDSQVLTLYRTEVSPGADPVAVTVQMRSFAEATGADQDTLFVGFVKDENNFVLVWHNNAKKRTGWDAVLNGTPVTRAGAEPLGALENEVDISATGSQLSLVLEGSTFTAFSHPGDEWEFLFKFDLGGVLDLSDPAVRSEYKYGFGVKLDMGTMSVERVEARRRPPRKADPVLSLRDDRIDADDTTIEVGVAAGASPVTGGAVTLREDGRSLGTALVVDGVAEITLAAPLAPGVHRLAASYSGSDAVAAADAPLTLTVDRAARSDSRVTAKPRERAVRLRRKVKVDVRVRVGKHPAPGEVEVVRRGDVVARGRLRRDGTAVLRWRARRPVGQQTYRVRYLGTAHVRPSADRVIVRVVEP